MEKDAGGTSPALLPAPLIQSGPPWWTHDMATLTSVPTSFPRRKSSLQVPEALLGTCFLLQKLLLGLTPLHTDLFVPSGAPNNEPTETGEKAEMSALVKLEDWVEWGGGVCVCSRTGNVRVTRCPPLQGTNRLPSGRWNFPELASGPCRGVGWYAKPADFQPSRLPPGQLAPGVGPTTMALKLASCL